MLNRLTGTLDFQAQALQLRAERQRLLASNIANADTPGYTAKELDFAGYLRDAVRQSSLPQAQQNTSAIPGAQMSVKEQKSTSIGLDGNTVDVAREMSDLAQAGTEFNFGAKMLQSRFRLLRSAIREGR